LYIFFWLFKFFFSIKKDFSQVLQMQAPFNFVFPNISRPQSAGTSWELFQPFQRMPGDQGIHFSEAKPHMFSGAIEDRPDASF
jgi:hypothetical protein